MYYCHYYSWLSLDNVGIVGIIVHRRTFDIREWKLHRQSRAASKSSDWYTGSNGLTCARGFYKLPEWQALEANNTVWYPEYTKIFLRGFFTIRGFFTRVLLVYFISPIVLGSRCPLQSLRSFSFYSY